jgi:hypothetical protein
VRRGAVSRFRVRHAAKVRVIINQSVRRGCIGMEKVSKMIQPCATTLRWVTCRSSFERRVYTKHSNRQQNAFESGACQPRVVAVLAPGDSQRQWPKDFQTVPITRTSKVGDGERVCSWASWSRFKGLEADAIVIIETAGDNDARERANRYVARSRAKHLLTVVQAA